MTMVGGGAAEHRPRQDGDRILPGREKDVLRMALTQNPPVKLSALSGTHGVVICDHVFHGRRTVCDTYYYIGGEISMSCAQADCNSADPAALLQTFLAGQPILISIMSAP